MTTLLSGKKTHVLFGDHDAIIMDNGSNSTKVGFSGKDVPDHISPTVIGSLVDTDGDAHIDEGILNVKFLGYENFFYGEQVLNSQMDKIFPVQKGVIQDFDKMISYWNHLFKNEFRHKPSEHPIHILEKPDTKAIHREKQMEVFFENFGVQNYYVSVDAVCTLVASGLRTGLVVDFGYESTNVVPIYETSTLNRGIKTMNYGTRDVIRHLNSELLLSTDA